jgi:hypothetical protein
MPAAALAIPAERVDDVRRICAEFEFTGDQKDESFGAGTRGGPSLSGRRGQCSNAIW